MAGLAIAATLAAASLSGLIAGLAGDVGSASVSYVAATDRANGATALSSDQVLEDGTVVLVGGTVRHPNGTIVLPDGTVLRPDGTIVLPDGTTKLPNGTISLPDGTIWLPDGTQVLPDRTQILPDGTRVLPDGTHILADGVAVVPDGSIVYPDGTIVLPDGTIRKPNGTIILPDDTYHVPQQEIPPHLQSVFDAVTARIDYNDDIDVSNSALESIIEIFGGLKDPADREALLAAFSDQQLERFFHNVDSSSFWSDDLSDKSRAGFYTLLQGLSTDQQKRLAPFTDYFERYDSDYRPVDVPISEADFVEQYEAIVDLPLDEFLALRAHLWENPELIADSPFDWYADGCSIPGGQYPGPLNAPCLRHDFAYSNGRQAGNRFNDEARYQDIGSGGIGDAWKNRADDLLRQDIAEIPPWELPNSDDWATVVYIGVAVDTLGTAGLGSGKEKFETPYVPEERFYGPGYDVNLGQDDDFEDRSAYDDLLGLAFSTAGPANE